ncbi:GDYXXLXY domain-containing protein [Hyunsoonleella sp. SJ7]|uniref:GDYXXLXY domain-containing protein n=1 Tax=Hyunsoonleella aquatilis TaxID=2762758 RepID=A0A923HA41_9FLAO|nr:GDYXXLXY domain-containing protein [Hyunsoonleella aquatilis]MBC3757872.1 GDYXXLXY domain-containing protein [Hyunsoonleella aquatilis]
MKSIYVFVIFIVVAIAQLFVPAQMIFNREDILATGKAYKFKTRPMDPSDPFRGKYITLGFEEDRHFTADSIWQRGEEVYVYLDVDSLGFAEVFRVSKIELPDIKKDFVYAKASWYSIYDNELSIEYPFDRFYMEESKAYDAEVAVQDNQNAGTLDDVYALVFIKEGEAVLDDVLIGEVPIKDYVEQRMEGN